jgi:hypothetical protein
MDITTPTRNVDLVQRTRDCFAKSNIAATDVEQFETLRLIRDENVGQQSEWDPYESYLQHHGSHILIRLQYGSRFQRWESSSASTANILNVLKAKACAGVEGKNATTQGWSVQGCADYSNEQRRKAESIESEWRQIAMGGTEATRVALTQEVTKDRIDAFIAAGSQGDRPIRFGFKPVWELWTQIYTPLCKQKGSKDCDNLQRANNLKIAYEGRLAIGCPQETSNNGLIYQSMDLAGKPSALGIQNYGCFAERTGCRSNNDCRKGGVFGVCYCYGASCFDQGAGIAGTNLFRTAIRANEQGKYTQGVNNSCRFSPGRNSTCGCNTTWSGGLPRRDLFRQPTRQIFVEHVAQIDLVRGSLWSRTSFLPARGTVFDFGKKLSAQRLAIPLRKTTFELQNPLKESGQGWRNLMPSTLPRRHFPIACNNRGIVC